MRLACKSDKNIICGFRKKRDASKVDNENKKENARDTFDLNSHIGTDRGILMDQNLRALPLSRYISE